jgi:protein-tyrosine-phosphatase
LSAGLDYPVWEVHRIVHGEYPPEASNAEPVIGVRQRHVRNDVVWWGRNVGQRKAARTTCDVPTNRPTHVDVERLSDPLPAIESYVATAREVTAIVGKRISRAPVLRKVRTRRSSSVPRAVDALSRADARALFVCRGNVCRSPFAAAWWASRHPQHITRSAGTLPRPGRLVPRRFEEAARARGVDLTSHRSSILSAHDLEWADAVIVMDFANLTDVDRLRRRSAVDVPVLLLGDVDGGQPVTDPFALPPDATAEVLGQMMSLLETLDQRAR